MDSPEPTRFEPDTWARARALFEEALALPPSDRDAFLQKACDGDAALRRQVGALLRADADDAPLLDVPVEEAAAALLAELQGGDSAPPAGVTIGPYRPVRVLGRGGMGTVYLAERADGQFEHRVALKLIRQGGDPALFLRRFLDERRILARLHHPNIARLLDGGRTAPTPDAPEGQPYFTMEYVEGAPITDYCDGRRLPVEARLALFEAVCEAVHYAHQNLVVHRDLKPSNVLVTEEGTERKPAVKLLDFGIAKALPGEGAGGGEALTREPLMTPEYAAPEQVRGAPVTTATDVYALGLVLYELLSGRRPFRLAGLTAAERERVISEETPGRPSAAVARIADDGPSPEALAEARGTTPEKLRRRLAGDLDAVVLKALRKEPARRYPSADALLDDLRRHREGLPVTARPASAAYRVRAFVRRHRAGVATAALVVLALVAGLGAALWQGRVAARERDEAETIAGFLENLLAAPDPVAEQRLDTLSVREVLARGTAQAQRELDGQPLLQARLLHVIGRTYRRMRLFDESEAALREALALRRAHLGPRHLDVAETLAELGRGVYTRDGDGDGPALLREALDIQRERLGPRHPETALTMAAYADALLEASALHQDPEADATAERMLREARAILQEAYGPYHPALWPVLDDLADRAMATGDMVESVSLSRQALAVQEHHHEARHPAVAFARRSLGWTLLVAGQPAEAERHLRTALAVDRATFGAESNTVREGLTTLASALRAQGRLDEAEAALREALAAGANRPAGQAVTLGTLATVLREQGDLGGATQAQAQAVALLRAGNAPATRILAYSVAKLADILREQGRYAEAETALLDNLAPLRASHGPADPGVQHLVGELAALYEAWGRPAQAAEYHALLGNPAVPRHPVQ
jgi:serine/threonine-protein kinase